MHLLELRAVSRSYSQGNAWRGGLRVRAVDNVSLAIAPGQNIAVVGASGSGKSTLGRLILGLERPDSGDVFFRGHNLRALRGGAARDARRSVQAVFQNSQGAVNPRFTAFDIIGEPLVNFDAMRETPRRARVEELLLRVGLSGEDMGKRAHEFSGGELQRICIARALAPRPALLVLDEATSSLDMVNQARILRLLADAGRDTGCAFVFISHDLRAVAKLTENIIVMDRGKRTDDPAALQTLRDAVLDCPF